MEDERASVETVSVGDGFKLPVAGRGTVRFQSRLCTGERTVVLHEVEHVPALCSNMVSLSQLEVVGAIGSFGGGGIHVFMGNVELMRARLTDGLYVVDRISKERDNVVGDGAASSGSLKTFQNLHCEDDVPHLQAANRALDAAQMRAQPKSFLI
jgi:hypothetical protein